MSRYNGPVLDAHHHLWDYAMGTHDWLDQMPPEEGEGLPMGDLAQLRRDFLPADYLEMAQGQNVVATIHVEAAWSGPGAGAETAWLDTLDRSKVARWHVFHADLGAADAEPLLRVEAAHPRAVGVRDIVAWHPDPNRSFVEQPARMQDTAWRDGLSVLAELGLVFDLMIYPHQAGEAAQLARDYPQMQFVVNHCASPAERSAEGLDAWRAGLAELASCPNVAIKISNPVAYDHDWTEDSLRFVILACLDAFGPTRSMYGSDAPVSSLQAGFGELLSVYRKVLSGLSAGDQRAFFHDTAFRIYRLGETGRSS